MARSFLDDETTDRDRDLSQRAIKPSRVTGGAASNFIGGGIDPTTGNILPGTTGIQPGKTTVVGAAAPRDSQVDAINPRERDSGPSTSQSTYSNAPGFITEASRLDRIRAEDSRAAQEKLDYANRMRDDAEGRARSSDQQLQEARRLYEQQPASTEPAPAPTYTPTSSSTPSSAPSSTPSSAPAPETAPPPAPAPAPTPSEAVASHGNMTNPRDGQYIDGAGAGGGGGNGGSSSIVSTVATGAVIGLLFCYARGTKVLMEDATWREVERIRRGDRVMLGGRVVGTGEVDAAGLYAYKDTMVTGTHAVFEDGRFIRVQDSPLARESLHAEGPVYPLITENHVMVLETHIAADFAETDQWNHQPEEERLAELNDEVRCAELSAFEPCLRDYAIS